ncbi:MAG: alpha/beta fold hydrolase, partial [Phreatobacter sp.]
YRMAGNLRGALAYYRAVFEDIEQNKHLAAIRLKTPILALGGDVGMSPNIYDAMKPLGENVEGGIVGDCGHYMPEEQPAIIAERMLRFFGEDL